MGADNEKRNFSIHSQVVIGIKHVTLKVEGDFDSFSEKLENLLGRITPEEASIIDDGTYDRIKALEGFQGLIMFGRRDHGKLLALENKASKAYQYTIGNPLIAMQMTKYDIQAAQYAPLRVLVFEDNEKQLFVNFDLPSTLFGQFNIEQVTDIGRLLDDKLYNLIEKASEGPA